MKTALGILATTLVVYIWGFLYWGISQIPYSAWKQVSDDVVVQQQLRETFPESGIYRIPASTHDPDTLANLLGSGPVAFVQVDLDGMDQMDPSVLAGGLVLNLVIVTLLAGFFRIAGAREFRDFARLSLAAGAVAVVAIDGGDIIWWQVPVEWKIWQGLYDFTVWLIAGHLLGLFMKEKAPETS